MSQSLSKRLINMLIDWLLAFCGVSLLLWVVLTQPVISSETKNITNSVDPQQLKKHVQLLTSGYAPRTINYDSLNLAANYIYRQLENFGIPEYQTINTISQQYSNVSLKLGPDTNELYVVGAHYDAEDDSIDTEGNASGIATLIELARHLAENSNSLKIGVILIAYPISLNQADNIVNTGSYFHADSLQKRNKKVRLMISLDRVGQNISSERAIHSYPNKLMNFLYPNNDNFVNLIGRFKDFKNIRELKKGFTNSSSLSLYSHNLFENFNKIQSSDHINYWKQGYPAVLISDAANYGGTKTHKSEVQPINRLNYEKMAKLVDGLFQVVMQTEAAADDKTQLAQRSRNKKDKSLLY